MNKCGHTLWSFDPTTCQSCKEQNEKLLKHFSKIDLKKLSLSKLLRNKDHLEKEISKRCRPYT